MLVLLLAMMTGLDALAIDIHLPAFAALARSFGATEARMALTLSAFLMGLALGQLIWAPLLDAMGRRRPALAGIGLFILASVFCALAGSLETMLPGRLVQGLGAAVAIMVPRVVVADLCDEAEQARIHSTLMQVFLVVPVLAPLLGGVLFGLTGWRGLFWLLTAAGGLVLVWAAARLPETLPPAARRPVSARGMLRSYRRLLRDGRLVALLLVNAALSGALFGYLGNLAGALLRDFGHTPAQTALVLAVNAGGLIAAGGLNKRLLRRAGPAAILPWGIGLVLVAAAGLWAPTGPGGLWAPTGPGGLWAPTGPGGLWAPTTGPGAALGLLFAAVAGLSLTFPNLTAMTMAAAGEEAGGGAALIGIAQNLGGGLVGAATGLVAGGMAGLGLAIALPAAGALGLLALSALPRLFTHEGYRGRP